MYLNIDMKTIKNTDHLFFVDPLSFYYFNYSRFYFEKKIGAECYVFRHLTIDILNFRNNSARGHMGHSSWHEHGHDGWNWGLWVT